MSRTAAASPKSQVARSVGRPRRLTLDQVLDAALELGLDDLTMAAVANRLGVGVAVLYSYVRNREELLRFAAIRAANQHGFPEDTGQPWANYIADYARALFELLTSHSQSIINFMDGTLGPEAQLDSSEAWLAAMTTRGFTPEEALRLLRIVGQLVLGCAATAIHARSLIAAGSSYSEAARRAVHNRSEEELPLLRQHVGIFADGSQHGRWEDSLRLLLESVAASRGEQLPPAFPDQ